MDRTLHFTSGLIIAALYALLGACGLTLAVPPGYASPLFPAAGLALAVVFRYGRVALPFIALGSLVLNLGFAAHSGRLGLSEWGAALSMAFGACAQAWAGQLWTGWDQEQPWSTLKTEKQFLDLLLRGGVLACLISASVGVSTLWALGLMSPTSVATGWWTWYLGDLLGVALLAPALLVWMAPASELDHAQRRSVWLWTGLALGLSVLMHAGAAQMERRLFRMQLAYEGGALASWIQDRLIVHQTVLSSLVHFVEANPDFSHRQFELFTQAALRDNSDLFALSFNDVVPHSQLRAYEAEVSKSAPLGRFRVVERDAQRRLVPVSERERYVVVRYIAPLKGNVPAVGFDIHSEPIRRHAIERGLASGKVAVTAPLRLVQENAVRMGVLMLEPVYRPISQGIADTAEEEPMGFAVAVIKVDELIDLALRQHVPPGLKFQMRDSQAQGDGLHFMGEAPAAGVTDERRWRGVIPVADRQWTLEVWAEDPFLYQGTRWVSWGVGGVALLITVLLQMYLFSQMGQLPDKRAQAQ